MKKFRILRRLILILIVFGLLFSGYYTYALLPKDYHFSNYEYVNKNLNSKLNGFKIAFLSDIHLSNEKSLDRFSKIIKKLNDYPFDMVIFGGDLYDEGVFESKEISNLLKDIDCKYGKFAILGEKDETDALEVTQILNNGGFEVLKNEVRTIYYNDTSFSLLAYNDEINPDQLKASDKSIKIGIAHQPDTFIQASNAVDLQISGHSCGGSIYIPYFGPLLPIDGAKTYNHGQYEKKGATLLVSNGISGPSSFPYKVFAKNEINFITLNSSSTR